MGFLSKLYLLFTPLFLITLGYFFFNDRFDYTYFYIVNAVLVVVWLMLAILLYTHNRGKGGRVSKALVSGIIVWGILTAHSFDVQTDKYGLIVPLIAFAVAFVITCWLNTGIISSHLFLLGLLVSMVIAFWGIDDSFGMKYWITFSTEGVREGILTIWYIYPVVYAVEALIGLIKKGNRDNVRRTASVSPPKKAKEPDADELMDQWDEYLQNK